MRSVYGIAHHPKGRKEEKEREKKPPTAAAVPLLAGQLG
jgi:hypothetical protein